MDDGSANDSGVVPSESNLCDPNRILSVGKAALRYLALLPDPPEMAVMA
jgi:hypothetical protein